MDGGAWWAAVHGVAESQTRLIDFTADTYDSGLHLNLYGAEKMSHWFGCIGEGNGTPLQYSCLENPMDGGAW